MTDGGWATRAEVVTVSADRLTDPKTNNSYFVAAIRPDREELAPLPAVQLYPGMPATAMIPTEDVPTFRSLGWREIGPAAIDMGAT